MAAPLQLVQVGLRDLLGKEVGGELDRVGVERRRPVDEAGQVHRALRVGLGLQVLAHRIGGEPDAQARRAGALDGIHGERGGRQGSGDRRGGGAGQERAARAHHRGLLHGTCHVRSQRWARRASIRSAPERRRVAGREVGLDVRRRRMPGIVVDTAGVVQDEAQREVGQRAAGRHERLRARRRAPASRRGSRREVEVAPVALRPRRVGGQRAGEAAFVERDAGDDGDAQLARRPGRARPPAPGRRRCRRPARRRRGRSRAPSARCRPPSG